MSQLPRRALLILGMHRSGTSVFTGVAQRLGVDLGPRLMPGSSDNQLGFWEREDVVSLHDQLLRRFGSSWDDVAPLPPGWAEDARTLETRGQIRTLLERDFHASPLWGIKDPRMCRLLPLWLPLLREMECEPVVAILTRDPLEIAASLAKRNQFSAAKTELLWLQHMLEAEAGTRGLPRAFTTYDEFLAAPSDVMARFGRELKIEWPRPLADAETEISQLIRPGLRHHSASAEPAAPSVIRNAFAALSRTGEPATVSAALEPARNFLAEAQRIYGPLLAERAQELQVRLHELDQQSAWKLSVMQTYQRNLEGQNAAFIRKNAVLQRKVAKGTERLEKTEQKAAKVRHELDSIRSALTWKLLRPLHRLERGLRPAAPLPEFPKKAPVPPAPATAAADAIPQDHAAASVLSEPLLQPELAPLDGKEWFTRQSQAMLHSFLASGEPLVLATSAAPVVSILLVLHGRAELTFLCLRSLGVIAAVPYEVVIVDNCSTDETDVLLQRVQGARILRNRENRHFLHGCNQAAEAAIGRHLLLFNNDTQLMPGSLEAALRTLESDDSIGAVGAKLILPDGSLQEAGSIVWQDGSCQGYGRGDDPLAAPYQFRRDVDYCSGAFLLTPRRDFGEGFDPAFAPAYYEEVDYCLRLWSRGRRVVYEPAAVILHYEFASSKSASAAIELQKRNRDLFRERHATALVHQLPASPANILRARQRVLGPRVLYVDDRVPHPWLGSGYPRAQQLVKSLQTIGCAITVIGVTGNNDSWPSVYSTLPREVEAFQKVEGPTLADFLRERVGLYDFVFISRPHNMRILAKAIAAQPDFIGHARIIYDAEAIFTVREANRLRLKEQPLSTEQFEASLAREMELTAGADIITAVSAVEAGHFRQHTGKPAHILGHCVEAEATTAPYSDRRGILFVGAMLDADSPNVDSILWFHAAVLPLLRARLEAPVQIVGAALSSALFDLDRPDFHFDGAQDDLTSFYERARVFIAPTRFAAGIPLKLVEAAARGIPIVTTSLLAGQLGWQHRVELLVADDAESFAACCAELHENQPLWESLRAGALQRIRQDFSVAQFTDCLRTIITPPPAADAR